MQYYVLARVDTVQCALAPIDIQIISSYCVHQPVNIIIHSDDCYIFPSVSEELLPLPTSLHHTAL